MSNFFKKYWYILFFSFFIISFPLFFLIFSSGVTFSINNNDHVFINLNDEYNYDVSACYGNKIFGCKNVEIKHEGLVDSSKVGLYEIVYSSDYKGHKEVVQRVSVVDKEAPVIDVVDSISVCPNEENLDVSYSAFDNNDGDMTNKVEKKVFSDRILLLALDSSFNSSLKSVSVVREDNEAPVITLSGGTDVSIALNTTYNEPGYSAIDNCDGDITDKVVVSGNVDVNNVGKYDLTYTVSDSSGKEVGVVRHVSVYKPIGNKVVYLTFDDGPSQYTGELLDILAKYNVKVTFFVTGRAPGYNYNIKRAHDEGHTVALHTNTHNYNYIYSSTNAYFEDLNAISETVHSLTGEYSKLIRFPGGSSNTVSRITPGIMSSLSGMVTEKGYKYFDWNVSSGDASSKVLSSDEYANNIIRGLGNSSYYIVLQHDTNGNSVRAVGKVIEYGLSHGYRFEALNMDSPVVHHKIAN